MSPCSNCSDSHYTLDLEDDEGWEDLEPDVEKIQIVSLFGEDKFHDVQTMLQHCKDNHQFDLIKIRKELNLDFLETMKLVNYVRREVQKGNTTPNVSSKSTFNDDQYLKPVLEDDALLYSLEDVIGDIEASKDSGMNGDKMSDYDCSATKRVAELEEALRSTLAAFEEYKDMVSKALDKQWKSDTGSTPSSNADSMSYIGASAPKDDDSHYFKSYSYNDIHETMLKDTVRTDAYRDFIYDNKHLFHGKVVLDVGCGTGILSMFCARAGAAKVIAVDNSDIINKARENIYENGMGDVITCLHGKIEEVVLPVPQVDVIVSEWMGYCLLYEAMLDSVLWARDHYLAPGGLMVPSNTVLYVAPFSDPDYIANHVTFWKEVYGFNMTSMMAHIYDEVLIRDLPSSVLAADSAPFLRLPLHRAQKEDLVFSSKDFAMTLTADIDELDGFVIWFDTYFLPNKDLSVPEHAKAENWGGHERKGVAFTTGPGGPETHWRQGVLLIDHSTRPAEALKKGQVVRGEIGYKRRWENSRELEIKVTWDVAGSGEKGRQLWFMR